MGILRGEPGELTVLYYFFLFFSPRRDPVIPSIRFHPMVKKKTFATMQSVARSLIEKFGFHSDTHSFFFFFFFYIHQEDAGTDLFYERHLWGL